MGSKITKFVCLDKTEILALGNKLYTDVIVPSMTLLAGSTSLNFSIRLKGKITREF
jgi:hypothetical protein